MGRVAEEVGGAGEGEGVADEAFGDGGWGGEGGVGGDGVDQVEAGAVERCRAGWVRGAVEVFEGGRRTRVTRGSQSPVVPSGETGRRRRGPKAEVPKALRGSRVARRVWGFCRTRVAGGDGEGGVEGLVGVGDFDLAGAGEGVGGFEREGELLVDGEIVLVGEMDGGVAGLADVLAEEGDGGAGGRDGDGEGEGAAVFEGEAGGEALAGVEFGGRGVGRKVRRRGVEGGCGFGCGGVGGRSLGAGVKVRSLRVSCWT